MANELGQGGVRPGPGPGQLIRRRNSRHFVVRTVRVHGRGFGAGAVSWGRLGRDVGRGFLMLIGRVSAALVVSFAMVGAAGAQDLPKGQWRHGDGKTQVNVAPCAGKICVTRTTRKDDDGGKTERDRYVVDVKPAGDGKWSGIAFDPKRKMKIALSMTVDGDRMTTHGCVLGGSICRSAEWFRVR